MLPFTSHREKVERRKRIKRRLLGMGVLCIGLAATCLVILRRNPRSKLVPQADLAEQILSARNAGLYDQARQLTADTLKAHPGDKDIIDISNDFQQELKPKMVLHFLKKSTFPPRNPEPGRPLVLTTSDEYYYILDLTATKKGYIYLFALNSTGEWSALFPNPKYAPNANPLPPAVYRIPDVTRPPLRVKPPPGVEKLFAVFANWRIEALEQFAQQLAGGSRAKADAEVPAQLAARLRVEDDYAGKIPGLKIAVLPFQNAGEDIALANQRR
jgi:hypothetical protein